MKPHDRDEKPRTEPRPEHPKSQEHAVAPPIEREHETLEGALEEDEKREHDQP
jgi:hypothetical protein